MASRAWYLVPVLFGFLGGLIAYAGLHNEDKEMADACFVIGVLVTVAMWFVWMAVFL